MLLFADEAPEAGYAGQGKETFGYEKYLTGFKEAVKSALDIGYFQSFFTELEDQAVKTSRSLASNIAGYSQSLEKSMMNVYKQTVKIGGSTKDVIDYAEAFATQTGRVPMIQEEVIVNAVKISKEFGISTKEVAAMAGEFTKVGLSQMAAVKMIRTIGETSRKYGVNASQLTKAVQENVKKSTTYTFKDGVEGLTKMAAKAQSLGVSFESTFSLYDKFLNPDDAIEFSSQMQMLGGDAAAQFGDPMRVMSMSVEEINEALKKSVSQLTIFDEKTGSYKMPKEAEKFVRLFAEKTGESVDNLGSMAVRSATLNDMLKDTKFNLDVSDEDKEILASRAQKMGGTWKVQIPTLDKFGNTIGTELKDVSKLTSDEIKKLGESEKEKQLPDDKQNVFNERFLSSAERQNNTLIQIRDALILKATPEQGSAATKALTTLSETASGAIKKITDSMPVETILKAYEKINESMDKYIKNTEGLSTDISAFVAAINKLIAKGTEIKVEDAFFPSGGAPVVMSEDEIYQGIQGDQILMGTNLDKGLDTIRQQQQTLASIVNTSLDIGTPSGNKLNPTLQSALGEKSTKLSEVMTTTTNTNINTTNTQNLSGGFTVTIDASKVPNSLDPTMLKNEMMKVMYQLNDEMKKQGVLNFKLK